MISAVRSSSVDWADDVRQPSQALAEMPTGWTTESPRNELRPDFAFEPKGGPKQTGSWVVTHIEHLKHAARHHRKAARRTTSRSVHVPARRSACRAGIEIGAVRRVAKHFGEEYGPVRWPQ